MRKIILLLSICCFLFLSASAQQIQWAYNVLEYSTQKSVRESSARQSVGMPNVLPLGGGRSHRNAWEPKGQREEFIKVGFLTPIIPKQVVIAETFHPGYISKVFLYDADGKEYQVAVYKPKGVPLDSRLLSINTSAINFYVLAVKVVLEPSPDKPVAIDAIGITESSKPVEIKNDPSDVLKSNITITRLNDNVNSEHIEMGPLVSPDGKTLYFSRRGDPDNIGGAGDKEDIWLSQWDSISKTWGKAKNMGEPVNNKDPNFINSISPDGNTILLGNSYFDDGTMDDGVSVSHRTKGGWTTPERLIIEDDENNSYRANFFMSNSQKILLMSIRRKDDTKGSRDIYVSFLKDDSTWTKPMNLGTTINTKGTESAPFLAADETTLYFTSDGLEGFGGKDIFVTRRLDNTWQSWSTPENMGSAVNTSGNESYLSISASGENMYYTSEIDQEGNEDMYVITLPPVLKPRPVQLLYGQVLNSKTNQPVSDVQIIFEDLATGKEVGTAVSGPAEGDYKIVLPSGKEYGYLAQKKGFVSVHSNVDLASMKEYDEIRENLYITPIETGQTIVLNNIFFDFDKYELIDKSNNELNRWVKLLKSNPNMKIEVSGHADNVGSEAYNDRLSQKRAEAVVNYLIAKSGVDKKRIILKYYGEQRPAASNSTVGGRQLNRRVECKIIAQ